MNPPLKRPFETLLKMVSSQITAIWRCNSGAQDAPEFVLHGGRVSLTDLDVFKRRPGLMMRLFEFADQMDKDVHPAALAAVTRNLNAVAGIRRDPDVIESFLNVISSRHHPAAALQLMNETGLLGKFLPEFGHVVARTQFNMYHHYTVDEHTLRAIEYISEIEHGRKEADHPLATQIFPQIAHRRALYLAMLLHDTGKGRGDHGKSVHSDHPPVGIGSEVNHGRRGKSRATRAPIRPSRGLSARHAAAA